MDVDMGANEVESGPFVSGPARQQATAVLWGSGFTQRSGGIGPDSSGS